MLSKLFSSNKRIKVLEYVLYQDTVTVSTVVKEISLSKGFVSEYLYLLYQNDILLKNKGYHPSNNPVTKAIKILFNVDKIKLSKIKKPYMKGIGLYGSWANGSNTTKSDLDIWIKTEKYPDEKELANLSKILREMTRSDIQLLVITPQKLEQIKKDIPFYLSLRYNSRQLWGEPIE